MTWYMLSSSSMTSTLIGRLCRALKLTDGFQVSTASKLCCFLYCDWFIVDSFHLMFCVGEVQSSRITAATSSCQRHQAILHLLGRLLFIYTDVTEADIYYVTMIRHRGERKMREGLKSSAGKCGDLNMQNQIVRAENVEM